MKKILTMLMALALTLSSMSFQVMAEDSAYTWNTADLETSYTTDGYLQAEYSVPDTFLFQDPLADGVTVTDVLTDGKAGSILATKSNGVGSVISGSGKNEWKYQEQYIEIDLGKYCDVSSLFISYPKSHKEAGRWLSQYKVSYFNDETGAWVLSHSDAWAPVMYTDADGNYYGNYTVKKDGGIIRTSKIRLGLFRPATSNGFMVFGEVVPVGKIISKENNENYAWGTQSLTNSAPLKAVYSLGSAVDLYPGGTWETSSLDYINDGYYMYMTTEGKQKTVLINYEDDESTNNINTENHYIQMDLDKAYYIDNLLVGIMSDNYDSSAYKVQRCNLEYYDIEKQEWVSAGNKDINWAYADGTKEVYKKRAAVANLGIITNALRFYPTATTHNRYRIDELVPYGKEVYDIASGADYVWNTTDKEESYTTDGYLPATYTVGGTFTNAAGEAVTDSAVVTSTLTDKNNSSLLNKSSDLKTQYIEMDLGAYCEISSLLYQVNAEYYNKNAWAAQYGIEYFNDETGEWEKTYTSNWATTVLYGNTNGNYSENFKVKNSGVVRTSKLRFWLYDDRGGGYIAISELIPVGKVISKANNENYAWGTESLTNSAPLKATYSLGSAAEFKPDGTWEKSSFDYINDGYYYYMTTEYAQKTVLINYTDDDNSLEPTENHYIQLDFDKPYNIEKLVLGVAQSAHNAYRLQWYQLHYFDLEKQEWISLGNKDVNWTYSDENKEVFQKRVHEANVGVKTNALRVYPIQTANNAIFRIDELIPYGSISSDEVLASFTYTVDGGTSEEFAANATAVAPVITIENPTEGKYENAKVITAFYNEGAFLEAKMTDMVNNSEASYSSALTIPDGTTEMKVFIWDLQAGLEPLSDVIYVKKKQLNEKIYNADNSEISYVGRWITDSNGYKTSYYGGAYAEAGFTGNSAVVMLGDTPQNVHIVVDGTESYRPGAYGNIDVSWMLDSKKEEHSVRVVSRYWSDNVVLKGFTFENITEKTSNKKIIEFIGDSITSGQHYADAANSSNKAIYAYPYLVGESLDCDHTQISISGITMTPGTEKGWGILGMSDRYFLTGPNSDSQDKWGFTYTPDLVVINLGTNDARNVEGVVTKPTDEEFTADYVAFIEKLREKYAAAEIFLMGTFGKHYIDATKAAVTELNNNGDSKVHFIDTEGWITTADGDFVDGVHPNNSGHEKVSQQLELILEEYLNN